MAPGNSPFYSRVRSTHGFRRREPPWTAPAGTPGAPTMVPEPVFHRFLAPSGGFRGGFRCPFRLLVDNISGAWQVLNVLSLLAYFQGPDPSRRTKKRRKVAAETASAKNRVHTRYFSPQQPFFCCPGHSRATSGYSPGVPRVPEFLSSATRESE